MALFALAYCQEHSAFQARNAFSASRLDRWQVLGPGGGGAQFNPTISPVDSNLVLANCDMTGAYLSLDGGDSWRMLNLGGVVRFFVLDPVDSNIIFAATEVLYRSTDKGKSWNLIYPKPADVEKVFIAGDHAEEQIILRGGERPVVTALAVDPANSKLVFASVSIGKRSSLYRSKDGGTTWGSILEIKPATRIYIDPRSPPGNRTLYLVAANSVSVLGKGRLREYKGPTGVNRFLDVTAGFPKGGGQPVFYGVSGMNWRGGDTGVTGAFVSDDGGTHWKSIPVDFLSNARSGTAQLELRATGTSLNYPKTAYLSFRDHTRDLPAGQRNMGVAKTEDGGKTWQIVWRDTDSNAATNVDDPWITKRFGPGWPENPFSLGVSPIDPSICFGTDFGRTMRTRDGGKTWQGVYARKLEDESVTTTGLDVLTVHGIQFDPFDADHSLVDFTDIGLFDYRRNGQSWKEASSRGIPAAWENTAYWTVFDPEVKGRVWAVVSNTHDLPRPKMWRRGGVKNFKGGVVISEDGGKSWKPSVDGMAETAPTHILLDRASPASHRTLYVCGFGKGVYKSLDGGRHWLLKNAGIQGSEPFAWRIVQDVRGQLYLLVARRGENEPIGGPLDGALYRSVDKGEHWQKLSLPIGCNAPNGLAIDPKDPNRLYLAAWGRPSLGGDTGGGIFVSADAGRTWKSVLQKDQHVFRRDTEPRQTRDPICHRIRIIGLEIN